MRLLLIILLSIAIYIAGVGTGFVFSQSYKNQSASSVTIIIASISLVITLWTIITEWRKENVLEYDGIYVRRQDYQYANKQYSRPVYYLRIKKKRGQGRVEECEGYITFGGKDMTTIWEGDVRYIPISVQADLKLFEDFRNEYTDDKCLIFRSNPTQTKVLSQTISYSEELLDKQISVRISCAGNARLPSNPFSMTIRDIIEQAKEV